MLRFGRISLLLSVALLSSISGLIASAQTAQPGSCLYALDPSADRAFQIAGAQSVYTACGIVVESTATDAFEMEGSETLYLENHSQVGVVGGAELNGQTLWDTLSNATVQPTTVASPGDPLASLAAPSGGTIVGASPTYHDMNSQPPNDTLSPGVYCGGLMIGNTNGTAFTMSPGVYVMAGGGLTLNSQAVVNGSGVTVYNTSSAGWGCSQSYSYKPITISGQVDANLSAPTTGTFTGILFFGDRSSCATLGSCEDQIDGGSTAVLNGVLYFPRDELMITGSNASGYLMLVADKIYINGNSNFGNTGNPYNGIAVSVTPPTSFLYGGQSQQFAASVTNTGYPAVTWSISPAGTGSISSSGVYTAPASIPATETVTVTATSLADTTKSASATITLSPPGAVSITPATTWLYGGQTQQFAATVVNALSPAVTWSISPAGDGIISASGLYTAPATISSQQTVTITATSISDPAASATATVTLSPPAVVSVTPTTAILYGGQTQQFSPSVSNALSTAVTWSISPADAGTISSAGLYTAPTTISTEQTVTLTATSVSVPSASASATVTLYPPIAINLVPTSPTLYASQAQQFSATVTNTPNTAVSWSISPAGAGSISSSGLYTAPATVASPQTVTITATSEANSSVTASSTVTLSPPIEVSISPSTETLYASQTQQFAAAVTNTTNSAVIWSINPAGAGTINASGLYTAPATISSQQTVTITATSQANSAATGSATVTLSLSQCASNGFGYVRAIVIDHTKVPNTDQINFPLLVNLTDPSLASIGDGGHVSNSSGYDIYFSSDPQGGTRLDHEIESYDPAAGHLVAWVRIPTLSHSSNTVIYMFYGNPSVTSSLENRAGVWDANYMGVWHLGNGFSLSLGDSTANGNNGTNSGAIAIPGEIAGGMQTNGSTFASIGTPSSLANLIQGGATFSAWIEVNPGGGGIVMGKDDANAMGGWVLSVDNNDYVHFIAPYGGSDLELTSATPIPTGSWIYVTVAVTSNSGQGNTATLYINGAPGVTATGGGGAFADDSNDPAFLANADFGGFNVSVPLVGSSAEFRISNTARSADWIATEYNNQSSPSAFETLGDENPNAVFPASTALNAGENQQFGVPQTGGCSSAALSWSIAPAGAGSIDSTGLYAAPVSIPNPQTVTVTATNPATGAAIGTASVSLLPPVTVTISPANPTVNSAYQQQLQFTATVANASNAAVTWSISPSYASASITSTGLYTQSDFQYQPTITVTASSVADPSVSASVNVNVEESSVAVSPEYTTLNEGQSQQFAATVMNNGNTALSWGVQGPGTISTSGLYTAPANVTSQQYVNIVANGPAGTGYASVTINPPAILVAPGVVTLGSGQTLQLSATVTNAANTAVTWSLSGAGTLSASGLYTAPAAFTAPQSVIVTATSQENPAISATATITLVSPTISVAPLATTVYGGQSQTFAATVNYSSNAAVTWSVSPAGTGSIDAAGMYTAPTGVTAAETITVTATSQADPAVSASATIDLQPGQCSANAYSYRRAIMIDHTQVPNTDQVNFPFLFNTTDPTLATVANGGHVTSAAGNDIIFSLDPTGATKLDHELEEYDPVAGTVIAWVRIPDLSHTQDTVVYMFYGNASVTSSQQNPTGVWDSNFVGVWHVPNGTALSLADSTLNGNTATDNGATATAGQIDGGMQTNGSTYATIGSPASLANLAQGNATFSVWVNPSGFTYGGLIGKDNPSWSLGYYASSLEFALPSANLRLEPDYGLTPGVWSYLTVALSGTGGPGGTAAPQATMYVNGQVVGTAVGSGGPIADDSSVAAYLGAGPSVFGFNTAVASEDEFRISNIIRSPDWIATEYSNQSSPSTFYALGGENAQAPVPANVTLYASQAQQFTASATATCNPGSVTWSISPSGAGAVSSSGLYTAPSSIPSQQTVTVTATSSADGSTLGTSTITLMPPLSVIVTPGNASLSTSGQQQQFTAAVANATNSAVNWTISPANDGSIDQTGLYTAPYNVSTQQTVIVTATSVQDSTQSGSATVTLLPTVSVNVNPGYAQIFVGQTVQLSASVTGLSDQDVTWSIQGPGTISSTGLYTAPATMAQGCDVYVTATSVADPAASYSAYIYVTPNSLYLSPGTVTLYNGQAQQFVASLNGNNTTAVTWSVSGPGTVSASGLYTAPALVPAQTSVTITAMTQGSGAVCASATITLQPSTLEISPGLSNLLGGQTQQLTAALQGGGATPVSWSISPAGAGSISPSGLYTAPATVASQQAVILTATSQNNSSVSGTATINLAPGQCASSTYGYVRSIVIDHTEVPNTDQKNFPFLFSATDPGFASIANGGHMASSTANDLIFSLDPSGATQLPYELEKYDPVAGQITAWIQIPDLSHTTDTVIYLFYGNSNITAPQENPAGVWDSTYAGVWHLANGTNLSLGDSTSNGNNGTDDGATAATGFIDGGMQTSYSTGAALPPAPSLANLAGGKLTLSGWVNLTGNTNQGWIMSDLSPYNPQAGGWGLGVSYNNVFLQVDYADQSFFAQSLYNEAGVPSKTWTYISLTLDGDAAASGTQQPTATLYIDGAPVGLESGTAQGTLPDDSSNPLYFGADPTSNGFPGTLDELRISNVIRSADWIATEYRNQSSPSTFFTLTPENAQTPVPSTVDLQAGQSQQFGLPSLGTCTPASVTWTASPAGTGTISSTGLYTAPAAITQPQTVTVAATGQANGSPLGSATVNLEPPISVSVTPGSFSYFNTGNIGIAGDPNYQQFSATVENAENTTVTWSISPADGGSISSTGYYSAPLGFTSSQTVTVIATSVQDPTKFGTATITLIEPPAISVAPNNVAITAAGQTQQFTASLLNSTNTGISWSVSPAGAGTITQDGLYTAPSSLLGQSNATVTATSVQYPNSSASATIAFASGIAVSPGSASLVAGQTQQFSASLGGFPSTAVNWSISPATIGSISSTGVYTAPLTVTGQEFVTVTATSQNNDSQSASATVTLNPSACASSGYTHVRTVVINHTLVPNTDQVNFPFLFSSTDPAFATTANGGYVTSSAGDDIIFSTDPNGLTKLDHELEEYNPVTGQVTAWVRIPALSHTSDTVLYVFYGNPNVTTPQQNPSGVWDSNFTAVYHLANVQSAAAADSTANGNNATLNAVSTANGEIGSAAGFNGISSFMQVPPAAFPNYPTTGQSGSASTFTASFGVWFRTALPGTILGQTSAGTDPGGNGYGADSMLYIDNSGYLRSGPFVSSTVYNDNNWHYAYLTYGNGVETVYVDGQDLGAVQNQVPGYATAYNYYAATGAPSGAQGQINGWTYLDGSLEEISVSDAARSGDWIATEYNNQSSPSTFYTLYPDQGDAVSVTPPQVSLYASQAQLFTVQAAGSCGTPAALWSMPQGSPGTLTAGGVYTAPNSIDAQQTVPITATTLGDTSAAYTANVTLLPPVSVSVTPSSVTIAGGHQQQFSASVSNTTNTAVTWTISPDGLGSISPTGLFSATFTVATQQNLTITATSVADPTKSASATIQLVPAVGVAISPSDSMLYAGQTQQFAAAVVNTDDTAVVWTVNPAGIGSISSSGLYTAPASVAAQQAVIITATSVADTTQSASASITLLPQQCLSSGSSGYSYSRAIVIHHTQVPNTDQINFPVLVSGTYPYLATVANGGRLQNASGYDVMFTSDAAGQSPLNYEIDSYNPTTGTVAYWVQLPYVSHTTDTVFYIWYGNPNVSVSQEHKTAVWSNGYAAVWHFGSGNILSTADSTSNANNGVNNGVQPVVGFIGGAGEFNGTGNSYIDIPANSSFKPATALTLEAWVNLAQAGNWPTLLSLDYAANGTWSSPWSSYSLAFNGTSLRPQFAVAIAGGSNAIESSTPVPTGQWAHIVGTYDGTTMTVYEDGLPVASSPLTGTIDYGTSKDLSIGTSSPYTAEDTIDGLIDEARISTVARSADWVATEYNNESSPASFYSISSENGFFVNPGSAVLYASQSQQFTIGAACSSGVSWSLPAGAPGTVTADGLYTAPEVIDAQQTVTLIATSQADSAQTATATITLEAQGVGISVTPASVNLTPNQTQQFTAAVTNTTNAAVTWAISANGVGSISADGVYSAPTAISASQTFTVTATSQADPSQSATATVTVSPGQCASSGYGYQRVIVIDHTKVPNTDQANFPFLFNTTDPDLASVNYGGHVTSPNGYDIFFSTDPSGQTKLDHEIEQYNPATGQLVAWVRIPNLSHTTDTTLYLFYGNPNVIASQANPAGVWDNSFQAVYHLANVSSPTTSDSTAYANNAGETALSTVAGPIDGGAGLNGTSSYLDIPNGAFPNFPLGTYAGSGVPSNATTTTFAATVEMWFRTASPGGLFDQKDAEYCSWSLFCSLYAPTVPGAYDVPGGIGFYVGEDGNIIGPWGQTSKAYDDNKWHSAVVTYTTDGTDTLYVDGQVAGTAQQQIPVGYDSSYAYFVGSTDTILDSLGEGDFTWMYLDGSLDEVRVSNIARSGDWVQTEYNNQSSPSTFYTLYAPTSATVVPSAISLYPTQTQQFAVTGTCSSEVGWSLSSGSPGVLTPTGLYTAPDVVSSAQSLTVTAISQSTGTTLGSAAVTLDPSPAPITLAAQSQPPYTVGSAQAFDATLLDPYGSPEPGLTVNFTVTGANPGTASATTDSSGAASWSYTGANSGNDTVIATAVVNGVLVTSNSVNASWTVPSQNPDGTLTLAAEPQLGRGGLAGAFTDNNGNVIQPIAIGASTAEFIVPANATQLQLGVDDSYYPDNGGPGFVVLVNGVQVTVSPTTMPWNWTSGGLNNNYQYGLNDGTAPVVAATGLTAGQTITIVYKSGTVSANYPSRPATAANGDPSWITGTTEWGGAYFPTLYTSSSAYPLGQPISFTAVVTNGSGAPAANVTVTVTVTGANPGQYQATTDATGTAAFTYTGAYAGVDYLNARAVLNGNTLQSTESSVTWISYPTPTPAGSLTLTYFATNVDEQGYIVLAKDASGNPLQYTNVGFYLSGADSLQENAQTDASGQAAFIFFHQNSGPFSIIAADSVGRNVVISAPYNNTWTMPGTSGSGSNNGGVGVSISAPSAVTLPNVLQLTGTVTDTVSSNPVIQWSELSGPGTVTFANPAQASTTSTFSDSGTYVLQLTASDSGATSSAQVVVTVNPMSVSSSSQGLIGSPLNGSTISGVVPITLAPGVTLQSGTLVYYPAANINDVTTLNADTTGSGQIGTLDTTTLPNGSYWIHMQSTDTSGNSEWSLVLVTVAGNYKPGRVTATVTDLVVPATGLSINIQRQYDSLNAGVSGDFGFGWNLAITTNLSVDPAGDVTFTLGGQRRTFFFTPQPLGFPFGEYVPAFTPEPGLYGTLTDSGNGCPSLDLLAPDGSSWQCEGGGQYTPPGYIYTDPTGTQYTISAGGNLQSIVDKNGNALSITANGITSSSGLNVPFVRDSSGRITQITDPQGKVYTYEYDDNGNLVSVSYPGISTPTTYTYDASHHYTGGTDFRGNVLPTTAYYGPSDTDANGLPLNGRVESTTDALGETTSYAYNLVTNSITTTYPPDSTGAVGKTTVVYDSYGDVLSSTDPLGNITNYAYDANHDLISTTDPLSHTTAYTYDSNGNRTSTTYPATATSTNTTSTTTYNQYSEPVSATDELGNVRTFTYDANYNPQSVTDSLGTLASFVFSGSGQMQAGAVGYDLTQQPARASQFAYDSFGNLTGSTDALGRLTSYTYNNLGQKVTMTTPLTGATTGTAASTTTYTYDALGNLTQTAAPLGRTTSATYDGNGNRVTSTDADGNVTTYTYDALNRLIKTTYPTQPVTTTTNTYDFRNNIVDSTDQDGHDTHFTYDLAGRMISVTRSYGSTSAATTTFTYDAAGHKLTETDPLGNTTTNTYDAAGNLLSVTGPQGNFQYAYDNARNQISVTDGRGNTTQYQYDARKRLTQTKYPDGTKTTNTYDGPGNLISVTDQAGNVVQYTYDADNELATMVQTDSPNTGNNTSTYGYDDDGNVISSSDENGHTTRSAYDLLSDPMSTTWPDGSLTEARTYDSNGNLTSVTHFNGVTTTYTYDSLNRLLSRSTPGEAGVSFTYTPTGKYATTTDASGTTTYTYDTMDRLVSKATPEGTLNYTYDADGHVLSIASSNANGASVSYTYDSLNRLSTVTDGRTGGVTTYTYDAANNLASATYPNGVQSGFQYDQLNRMTSMTAGGAGYVYTLGPTGNRTGTTEQSGRAVQWSFDGIYRLSGETVSNDPSKVNGNVGYTLDPVGNRLSQSSSLDDLSSGSFSYNADDELSGESYDQNGNVTAAGGKTFTYDSQDELVSMNGGAGAVSIVYDGFGNRVAETVNGVTTRYLVEDDVNPTGLPQVFDELTNGAVTRTYTYGLQRIDEDQIVNNSWTASYYGYDGFGTVRQLTNAAGAVTDSYEYDAFGNEISSTGSTPNNYLYRGEQWDPNLGLYYLRARYYNPLTGRFMGIDPLVDEGEPRYEYAGADPVDGIDPNGDEDLVEYRPLIPGRLPVSFPFDFPGWCETASSDALGSYLPGCSAPGGNGPGGPGGTGSGGGSSGPPPPSRQHEVTVSFWPLGASRFGHIGVGVDSLPDHERTNGFATYHQKSSFRDLTCIPQRGIIDIDQLVKNYMGKPVDYMRITGISDAEAKAMENEISSFPSGWYDDCFWNCATFVGKVLSAGSIPNVPPYNNSPMVLFFYILHSADGYSYYRTTNNQ